MERDARMERKGLKNEREKRREGLEDGKEEEKKQSESHLENRGERREEESVILVYVAQNDKAILSLFPSSHRHFDALPFLPLVVRRLYLLIQTNEEFMQFSCFNNFLVSPSRLRGNVEEEAELGEVVGTGQEIREARRGEGR